jgi:hypothetical protein
MGPWPLPTINTALLLTSGVTLTIAHHALIANQRGKTIAWMWITVALGATFLVCAGLRVHARLPDLNLKLSSGIFGSTFFMLTGFHGFHVLVGMLMLLFITLRLMKGHFTPSATSASRARPGTGTSSTWSGWACTSWSTGSDARLRHPKERASRAAVAAFAARFSRSVGRPPGLIQPRLQLSSTNRNKATDSPPAPPARAPSAGRRPFAVLAPAQHEHTGTGQRPPSTSISTITIFMQRAGITAQPGLRHAPCRA